MFERDIHVYLDICKSQETADGRWLVHGQVASSKEDYDGEVLEKAGVAKGLDMFKRLGAHVDYEHQYSRTKDPDVIIGKGVDITYIEGAPYLTTELYKSKPLAQKVWRHLQAGGAAGYSLEGRALARDPKNPKRVTETEIHRITISPSPKGYDNRLYLGAPSLQGLAKAIVEEGIDGIPQADEIMDFTKSLTTGEGIVMEGERGGAALRKQALAKKAEKASYDTEPESKSVRCPDCKCRYDDKSHDDCPRCGDCACSQCKKSKEQDKTKKGVATADELSKALAYYGVRNPKTVSRLIRNRLR